MLLRQEISLEVIYVEAVTPKHFNYLAWWRWAMSTSFLLFLGEWTWVLLQYLLMVMTDQWIGLRWNCMSFIGECVCCASDQGGSPRLCVIRHRHPLSNFLPGKEKPSILLTTGSATCVIIPSLDSFIYLKLFSFPYWLSSYPICPCGFRVCLR